ncbi:flagellin N-terminal helical domain-containing protein [Lacunimicrobium album]
MSIGPLLPGRIPSSLKLSRSQSQLTQQNYTLQKLSEQITTGNKFQLPSESPAEAIKTIILQKSLEKNSQLQANIQASDGFLSATENALNSLGDVFNRAKSLLLAGTGDNATTAEKQEMAEEVSSLIKQALNFANTEYNDRYLFAGSNNKTVPFTDANGTINYNGNGFQIESYVGLDQLLGNSIDATRAFDPFATVSSGDLNPTLSMSTKIDQLLGGKGVSLGTISVTVDTGGGPQTEQIDLSGAKTLGDLKTRIEAPFGGDLTLDIDPATGSGLRLTPTAGTVAVADQTGKSIARDLGIASAAAAVINGGNVNPTVSLQTPLSAFNGGTFPTVAAGTGIQLTLNDTTVNVDLSGVTTVEGLFNAVRATGLDLNVGLSADGSGIEISSKLSGANFSIGEYGGTAATDLGLRTLDANTKLADLNLGYGAHVDSGFTLDITRRDGTTTNLDLSTATTMQDVLTAINAIDPGNLVASFVPNGNGIQLVDNSGTGPLTIGENIVSKALGLNGSETGTDPLVPLTGKDVNPQRPDGMFDMLYRLRDALESGDDVALGQIDKQLTRQLSTFTILRGDVGARLKSLDDMQSQLADQELNMQESLSQVFEIDITQAFTDFSYAQFVLQATQQITANSLQQTLLSYL